MSLIPHYMPEAFQDIAEIGLYFAERDQTVEERFCQALEKTINTLVRSPDLGERCRFRSPAVKGMRVWQVTGFPNYLIFYRANGNLLEILRVLHAARDYAKMFDSES